ncbi:DUF5011 domain-containing protein [Acholeplasma sp. OttesenSCG-928-E16]|nr:DUF5011 domain-containing protein [Acholeplasma sp. OttesenSCG-928-E16]
MKKIIFLLGILLLPLALLAPGNIEDPGRNQAASASDSRYVYQYSGETLAKLDDLTENWSTAIDMSVAEYNKMWSWTCETVNIEYQKAIFAEFMIGGEELPYIVTGDETGVYFRNALNGDYIFIIALYEKTPGVNGVMMAESNYISSGEEFTIKFVDPKKEMIILPDGTSNPIGWNSQYDKDNLIANGVENKRAYYVENGDHSVSTFHGTKKTVSGITTTTFVFSGNGTSKFELTHTQDEAISINDNGLNWNIQNILGYILIKYEPKMDIDFDNYIAASVEFNTTNSFSTPVANTDLTTGQYSDMAQYLFARGKGWYDSINPILVNLYINEIKYEVFAWTDENLLYFHTLDYQNGFQIGYGDYMSAISYWENFPAKAKIRIDFISPHYEKMIEFENQTGYLNDYDIEDLAANGIENKQAFHYWDENLAWVSLPGIDKTETDEYYFSFPYGRYLSLYYEDIDKDNGLALVDNHFNYVIIKVTDNSHINLDSYIQATYEFDLLGLSPGGSGYLTNLENETLYEMQNFNARTATFDYVPILVNLYVNGVKHLVYSDSDEGFIPFISLDDVYSGFSDGLDYFMIDEGNFLGLTANAHIKVEFINPGYEKFIHKDGRGWLCASDLEEVLANGVENKQVVSYKTDGSIVTSAFETQDSDGYGFENGISLDLNGGVPDGFGTGGDIDYMIVKLVDVAPVISGVVNYTLTVGDAAPNYLKNVKAVDKYDGDVVVNVDSSNVKLGKAGTYYLIYTAIDSAGNLATKTATVTVESNPLLVYPEIVGESVIETDIDNPISLMNLLKNYTAVDENDGNLTSSIVVVSDNYSRNKTKLGSFQVTISVTNSVGNTSTKIITVKIKDLAAPQFAENTLTEIELEPGERFDVYAFLDELVVTDNYTASEDLTITVKKNEYGKNQANPGQWKVIYQVMDESGNTTDLEVIIKVPLRDLTNGDYPILNGPEAIYKSKTSIVVVEELLFHFTASDTEDGDISSFITIQLDNFTGKGHKVGTYKVIVEVTDSDDNTSALEFELLVVNSLPKVLYVTSDGYIAIENDRKLEASDFETICKITGLSTSTGTIVTTFIDNEYEDNENEPGFYEVVVNFRSSSGTNEEVELLIEVLEADGSTDNEDGKFSWGWFIEAGWYGVPWIAWIVIITIGGIIALLIIIKGIKAILKALK